jgi:hypothetical protein
VLGQTVVYSCALLAGLRMTHIGCSDIVKMTPVGFHWLNCVVEIAWTQFYQGPRCTVVLCSVVWTKKQSAYQSGLKFDFIFSFFPCWPHDRTLMFSNPI